MAPAAAAESLDDDGKRNRLCPADALPDDPRSWARMQARGTIASRLFGAEHVGAGLSRMAQLAGEPLPTG